MAGISGAGFQLPAGVNYKFYASAPLGPNSNPETASTAFLLTSDEIPGFSDALTGDSAAFTLAYGRLPWPGERVRVKFIPVDIATGVQGIPVFRTLQF